MVVRAKTIVATAVPDHACLQMSICVIVAKLSKFRVQTTARISVKMTSKLEGVVVFVAIKAKPPVFSESISTSGG